MKNLCRILALLLMITVANHVQGQTDTVCAGSNNKIYDVNPTAGSSYSWLLRNGSTYGSISTVAGRSDSIVINFGTTAGTDTLQLVEVGATGCYSDTVKLAILILPNVSVTISGTDSICNNNLSSGKLSLVFTGTPPFSCTYTDGITPVALTNILTNTYAITSLVYTTAGIKPYTISSASGLGSCMANITGTASVTVFPKPSPGAINHY
ncbi:MAG: hypothetical protein SGJ00_09050 [bacterium]|nr:hypothetical protein [bacterium]